jgi:hypothetical protein
VRSHQLDPVSRAQVGEAMGQLAVGIEAARQSERAQRIADREDNAVGLAGLAQEVGIEIGVVRHEASIAQAGRELGQHLVSWGRFEHHLPTDAVDADGADAEPPAPAGCDEAGPPIEHTTVAIDHDQADLQHVMAAQRQPRCLYIDHGEPHLVELFSELLIHRPNPTPGV